MASQSRTQAHNKSVNLANSKAYLYYPIAWSKLLGEPVANLLTKESIKLNSRNSIVNSMFMAGVSFAMGPNVTLQYKNQSIRSPLYILAIGKPGTGKTPAFTEILRTPFRKLEEESDKGSKTYMMEDFTKAGLLHNLETHRGHLLYGVDEICQQLETQLGKRTDDAMSLRSNLNNFWSCTGFSKGFATKSNLKIKQAHLVIAGTTQPPHYIQFLNTISTPADGLRDRFIAVCAHRCPPTAPADDEGVENLPNHWAYKVYKSIMKLAEEKVVMRLTEDAEAYLQSVKDDTIADTNKQYQELEQKLIDIKEKGEDGSYIEDDDIPEEEFNSKEVECALRVAMVVTTLRVFLKAVAEGKLEDVTIPKTVDQMTLRESFDFLSKAKKQEECYWSECQSMYQLKNPETSRRIVKVPKTDVDKDILLFPGKIVPSLCIVRRNRNYLASEVVAGMADLADKCGKFRKLGNKSIFYKAPWHLVDKEFMLAKRITEEMYNKSFQTKTDEDCPVSGMYKGQEWKKYYASLDKETPVEYK